MDALLSRKLMEYLQRNARGRKNAVPRDKILDYLRPYAQSEAHLSDRAFRRLYAALPVCTTAKGEPKGMFIPRTPEEVEEFRKELFEKVPAEIAQERYKTVIAYYPNLALPVGEQPSLF